MPIAWGETHHAGNEWFTEKHTLTSDPFVRAVTKPPRATQYESVGATLVPKHPVQDEATMRGAIFLSNKSRQRMKSQRQSKKKKQERKIFRDYIRNNFILGNDKAAFINRPVFIWIVKFSLYGILFDLTQSLLKEISISILNKSLPLGCVLSEAHIIVTHILERPVPLTFSQTVLTHVSGARISVLNWSSSWITVITE